MRKALCAEAELAKVRKELEAAKKVIEAAEVWFDEHITCQCPDSCCCQWRSKEEEDLADAVEDLRTLRELDDEDRGEDGA